MPVISNTSPILSLAIVDHLDLMRQQFYHVLIPPAVLRELKIEEERPGSAVVRVAITAGWIQLKSVTDQSLVQVLQQTLDQGEAEAIALALEQQAQWIILDERDARKKAKLLGLQVTGVVGILLRAKQSGTLASLQPVMEVLTTKAGFRIAPDLLTKILQA